MIRSTLASFSRRSASLMATSVLDCASASTVMILWPSTPPFSLTMSMAILLPMAAALEPPAANGPVWS